MRLNFNKRHWSPIGLELDARCIRMVQLYESRDGLILSSAYEQRQDVEGEDSALSFRLPLRRMLEEYGLHGRRVVVGLPADYLHVTTVRIAEVDCQRSLEEAVRQAAWRLGWDPELHRIEAIPAGRIRSKDQAKIELLLMAVKNQDISDLLHSLDQCDVEVVGLDPLPCAVFRNARRCMKQEGESDALTAFVHVGRKTTQVVFGQDEGISFIKKLPLGTENFVREITQKLDIEWSQAELLRTKIYQEQFNSMEGAGNETLVLDHSIRQAIMDSEMLVAEELCKELSLCLRYYTVTFRGQRVQQVLFSGGEGDEMVLQNHISQAMHVPVKPVNPFIGLRPSAEAHESSPLEDPRPWAVPMGLALKRWDASDTRCHTEEDSPQQTMSMI